MCADTPVTAVAVYFRGMTFLRLSVEEKGETLLECGLSAGSTFPKALLTGLQRKSKLRLNNSSSLCLHTPVSSFPTQCDRSSIDVHY